jgi:hypothetical protein
MSLCLSVCLSLPPSAECIFVTVKPTAVQDLEELNTEKQHPLTLKIHLSKRLPIKSTDKRSVKKVTYAFTGI